MKVKSESEVAQSCTTLCDPMDWNLPGSSVHGIFQARVLEWVAIAFSEIITKNANHHLKRREYLKTTLTNKFHKFFKEKILDTRYQRSWIRFVVASMFLILVFNNCYNKLPQVYQLKITIIYYFTICVGLKSRWAKLDSLLRFSQGWNQGVRKLEILSGDSGGESDSRLIQVVGRIHFHKGVELRSPFPSCLLSGIVLSF